LRRGKIPRYIKDSTMSNYINELKNGTRYRESGLVHGHIAAIQKQEFNYCFQHITAIAIKIKS
jgi:hypothetical protein